MLRKTPLNRGTSQLKKTPLSKKTKTKGVNYWRDKCVTLAKRIVRHKAGYKCQYTNEEGEECGIGEENGGQTHGSHIHCEHVHHAMSAELTNILCLCSGHHVGMGNVTPNWHKDPRLMMRWFERTFPEQAMELDGMLKEKKQIGAKEWQEKYEELKEIWNNLIN